MPRETINLDEEQVRSQENEIQSVEINKLAGRICYFSLAGDLALDAFSTINFSTFTTRERRKRIKTEFTQRLYLAILMFDTVVMHCSDPLRSEMVLEVLEEHSQWIKTGHIVFIFSDHIVNIKDDYKEYIDEKIKEYSGGFYSEKEANSLRQDHIDEDYYKRVIDLLMYTKCIVRKPAKDKYSFDKLVIYDLDRRTQTENVIIDSHADLSQILSLNLSLYQLLHIRHLICMEDEENEKGKFVFPQYIVNDLIEKIKECLHQGNTIARSAIVVSIEEKIKNDKKQITKLQRDVLKAITLRMDILYCKMNSGDKLILEFHPWYEVRSNYQLNLFHKYLKIISNSKKDILLTPQVIDKILQEEALGHFRMIFLNFMADMHEHMKLEQFSSTDLQQYGDKLMELFNKVSDQNKEILNIKSMNSIAKIIREAV